MIKPSWSGSFVSICLGTGLLSNNKASHACGNVTLSL